MSYIWDVSDLIAEWELKLLNDLNQWPIRLHHNIYYVSFPSFF